MSTDFIIVNHFAPRVVTLPCREAFLSIAPQVLKWWKRDDMGKLPLVAQEVQGLMKDQHANIDKSYASINHDLGQDYQHYLSIKNEDNVIEESNVTENIIHVVATFAITASTFLAAVAAPGKFFHLIACNESVIFHSLTMTSIICFFNRRRRSLVHLGIFTGYDHWVHCPFRLLSKNKGTQRIDEAIKSGCIMPVSIFYCGRRGMYRPHCI